MDCLYKNKEFLETDYPRGKPYGYPFDKCHTEFIEVLRAGFASFILASGPKTEIHCFTSPETANSSFDLSKGEVDTETSGLAPGNSFD